MPFTSGDDLNILQASDTNIIGAGAGNDTYIVNASSTNANQVIQISDTQGANVIKIVGGVTIVSSVAAADEVILTLSNGAKIDVLGAASFTFEIGGDAFTTGTGTSQTFAEFLATSLGIASVPTGTDTATGNANVTTNTDGTVTGGSTGSSEFSIAAATSSVAEGNSGTTTTISTEVTRTGTGDATVDVAIAGVTATAGTDFTAFATQTVSFTGTETSKTVSVVVTGDNDVEPDETLTATLSNASTGSTISSSANSTTLTITNDDAATSFAVTSDGATNNAEGDTVTFTVTPSGTVTDATTFTYSITGNTLSGAADAASSTDFDNASGTISFAAGATGAQTTVIQLISNDGSESLEGYTFTLLDSSLASAGSVDGQIIDGTSGQSLLLTSTADNLTGSSGNDTFSAVLDGTTSANTTLSAADQLDGAAGTEDILKITLQGDTSGAATVAVPSPSSSNIEQISVRNVSSDAATVTASAFIGATEFINDRSTATVEFTSIGTADLTIIGNDVVTNGATDFTSGSSSVTDALTINVKDGVGAGAITNQTTAGVADTNGDWTAVTINSTGGTASSTAAANVVGNLVLSGGATMQTLTVNATTSFTSGTISGWDTTSSVANKGAVIITGAGAVNIGTLNDAVETVDASGNSGGTTFTIGTQTDAVIIGSTGDDTITSAGILLGSTGSIAAGDGTADRLILTTAIASSTANDASAARYTGFEALTVNNITQDVSIFTGSSIAALTLTGATTQVSNITSTQAADITIASSTIATIGVKDATNVGQIDTVKIDINDASTTVNTLTLTTPVLTGIEKVELTATDNVTISALTSATALTDLTISGAATSNITSGALSLNVNTVIDASAATGASTIDFSAALVNAFSYKGSSAADTITDSVITGSSISGNAGSDGITLTDKTGSVTGTVTTVTGGTGADATGVTGVGTDFDQVKFNFADGDSISSTSIASNGVSTGSTGVTDTVTGITNVTVGATAGSSMEFDTAQQATAVTFSTTAITFGTTTVTNAFDFYVLDNHANTSNSVIVYQDTDGDKIIEDGEFAIMLTGTAQMTTDEFTITSGDLFLITT